MTEYQTHTALVATLETEIVRLRAVNAELRSSIQAPIQPDTKLVEAARQALETLEFLRDGLCGPKHVPNAITSLREALETVPQPAAVGQEPVAFLHPKYGHMQRNTEHIAAAGIDYVGAGWLPLYTAPQPARQQHTHEEKLCKRCAPVCQGGEGCFAGMPQARQVCMVAFDVQPARQPLTDEESLAIIPGGRITDKWESSRVADYNSGWNDYRKAAKAALQKLANSKVNKEPEWYVRWIRNNYQDYANISQLCDALTAAAHAIEHAHGIGGEE